MPYRIKLKVFGRFIYQFSLVYNQVILTNNKYPTRCKKITDQSLDKLTYHIGYTFQGLKALQLDFRKLVLSLISSLNIISVVPFSPPKLLNLFRIISKIVSKGYKHWISNSLGISFFPLLIILHRCELIDDEGIKAIHNLIGSSLPQLRDISLVFSMCPKISLKAVRDLCTHLNLKSVSLQNLLLDFEG